MEAIRDEWERKNEMCREIVRKIDIETDPKRFWKKIGRMIGRRKRDRVEVLKDENEVILRNVEDIEEAFR